MSRIGKKPIAIPAGVTATVESGTLTVKAEDASAEYEVGYASGAKDRAESDRGEITRFEEQFAQLEIKR